MTYVQKKQAAKREFIRTSIENAKRIDKVTRGVNTLKLQFASLDAQSAPAAQKAPAARVDTYSRYFSK